jgi:PAS domain S-box-containing protein
MDSLSTRSNQGDYRVLFETNPQPMWIYDLGTLDFLAVNNAAIERYGYTRDEFLAMTIKDIRPPEDVDRLKKDVASPRPDFQYSTGWRHRLKDGQVIDVEITSHTLTFAGRTAALVMAQDVTDVVQMVERLQRLSRTYAVLSDHCSRP